jgi:hypothetical protein
MKIVVLAQVVEARVSLCDNLRGDCMEVDDSAVACNPDNQTDPRCI